MAQETGNHALIDRYTPSPYPSASVLISRSGQPEEKIDNAVLRIAAVYEKDVDADRRADATEDRTDLRISSVATRDADGRARLEVTMSNAGPLTADLLTTYEEGYEGWTWDNGCSPSPLACGDYLLHVGQTLTYVAQSDTRDAMAGTFGLGSEGPDLNTSDNRTSYSLAAAPTPPLAAPVPAFDLSAAGTQHLRGGIKVRLRGVRAGRARLTLTFIQSGRTIKVGRVVTLAPSVTRTFTIHPAGAKLRSLRRMLAKGPLTAHLTVRTINGKTPVTAKVRVRR